MNTKIFSIEIYILSNSDKIVLIFKWLFYSQGTEVYTSLQDRCHPASLGSSVLQPLPQPR